jgi:hypothetical protein
MRGNKSGRVRNKFAVRNVVFVVCVLISESPGPAPDEQLYATHHADCDVSNTLFITGQWAWNTYCGSYGHGQ